MTYNYKERYCFEIIYIDQVNYNTFDKHTLHHSHLILAQGLY